jgi:hypothetical protein
MPGTTGLNAPQGDGRVRASSTDSFARFCQIAAMHPEKLRHMPALAKELGIGESTAYKYRHRFAQLRAEEEPGRNGATEGRLRPLEPPSTAQPLHEDQGQLTPEEVDHEIAKILLMARRIRGFRRTRKDIPDEYVANRLGIEVADIEKTLRFEQVYVALERRVHHHKNHPDGGGLRE